MSNAFDKIMQSGGSDTSKQTKASFASVRNAIKSFIENLPFMRKVSANDVSNENVENEDDTNADAQKTKVPKPNVTKMLFDHEFIESVKGFLSVLDPVAELINKCQKIDSSAADGCELWLSLLKNAPSDLKELAEARCERSNVFNDVTITANYLHPVYRGLKLHPSHRDQIEDYIMEELGTEGLESYRKFVEGEEIFQKLADKNVTSPKTYWYHAKRHKHFELSELASKLLKIPASTAQLERLFSNWKFIHSDIRNRLSEERSKKLLDIYFTLRSNDEIPDDSIEDEIDDA